MIRFIQRQPMLEDLFLDVSHFIVDDEHAKLETLSYKDFEKAFMEASGLPEASTISCCWALSEKSWRDLKEKEGWDEEDEGSGGDDD